MEEVTYEVAKLLARIHRPLIGQSPYHTKNTKDFLEQVKIIMLEEGECINSCDVNAVFTSVPMGPAINTIRNRPEPSAVLYKRASMSINHIIILLDFDIKNTYFLFQSRFYEQVQGASMGSCVSPIVANFLWRTLKPMPSVHQPILPRLWRSYVNDTLVILETVHKKQFLEHINSIHPCVKFTTEETRPDGSIPFRHPKHIRTRQNALHNSVQKMYHTDHDLYWTASTTLLLSIVSLTPSHRVRTVCSNPLLL